MCCAIISNLKHQLQGVNQLDNTYDKCVCISLTLVQFYDVIVLILLLVLFPVSKNKRVEYMRLIQSINILDTDVSS